MKKIGNISEYVGIKYFLIGFAMALAAYLLSLFGMKMLAMALGWGGVFIAIVAIIIHFRMMAKTFKKR